MVRAPSNFIAFCRQKPRNRLNSCTRTRNLILESGEGGSNGEELKLNKKEEDKPENDRQTYAGIVREVCDITRTRPRWEQTLASIFPSFNFSDPKFFHDLLSEQNNVFLTLRFFQWVHSRYEFSPDAVSCRVIFDALVEAKALQAAQFFLHSTGFSPDPASLECYIRCQYENGLVEDGCDVLSKLQKAGFRPAMKTWNSALLGCLKVGRTDIVWKLYQEMMESGAVADVDAETVGCLIQAFCEDGKSSEGYELLQQVLEDGLEPGNVTFNKLIAAFCKERKYTRVSEILHRMIARNQTPDIYTYQEVINGLCKKRKRLEGYRIFNDLKDRGYAPDRVMYTTMIHGLCEMGWLGDARKLWFEMINKGLLPNEFTYNALIHGYCKIADFEEAKKVYKEMCARGYGETTVTYNTMIAGFCLHGWTDEAHGLFEEMSQKGIARDIITYNTLIRGFCKTGKVDESKHLLKELLTQGLQPSTSSYTSLIEKLCQVGELDNAKRMWNDMQSRGLKPNVCSYDHIITGLCGKGDYMEGLEWLVRMLENRFKPQKETFEGLVQCLIQNDKLDDSLFVLDSMFRIGYALKEGICHYLVTKFCKQNFHFVAACLGQILEEN